MSARTFTDDDRKRLERLREGFLEQPPRSRWRDRRDLELYDATFGRRIGWKWAAWLDELAARGFAAPQGDIVDLGCGTGIASRAWLARFGNEHGATLRLVDSFAPAVEIARELVRAEHPAQTVEIGPGDAPPGLLIVSHVLGELSDEQRAAVVELARSAAAVVWLEPGDRATSRALGRVRDELRERFEVVAPCTHENACPLLALGRDADWCHFFARPPQEAFTDSGWAWVGRELGIDLRSLPYSALALRKERVSRATPPSGELVRVLARPRTEKGRSRVEVCGVSGVRELSWLDRDAGDERARLRDPAGECLRYVIEDDGKRVRSWRREP